MSQLVRLEDIALTDIDTIEQSLFSTISRTQIRVHESEGSTSARWVAVKSASIHPRLSEEPHDIVKELRLLSGVSHANIVAILGSQKDNHRMVLKYWMEYIPYYLPDLLVSPSFSPHPIVSFSTPAKTTTPSPKEARFTLLTKSITYQILSALAYLHDPLRGGGIAHRDIKPGNILLNEDGCAKVIDFGVAWKGAEDDDVKKDDLWPEKRAENMYFEVATGPYRAPELLFGPHSYDAFATDLWSFGATFAEFFRPLRLSSSSELDEDDDRVSGEQEVKPFIIPADVHPAHPSARWRRMPLFDADRGEIGLAWSIFRIRGTPTEESWPEFRDLPDATKVTFVSVPTMDLASFLPNLPPSTIPPYSPSLVPTSPPGQGTRVSHAPPSTMSPSPLDLLHRLLVYPPLDRICAEDALKHHWFTAADSMVLLPSEYPVVGDVDEGNNSLMPQVGFVWEGKTLGEWLRASLPQRALPSEGL